MTDIDEAKMWEYINSHKQEKETEWISETELRKLVEEFVRKSL